MPTPARRAIAQLTREQRTILLLRLISQLSVDRTAQIMQSTPHAVLVAEHRAMIALRRHLADTPYRPAPPTGPVADGVAPPS